MDKMNFIIISTADWDNPFWTNKQHVAKTLSEMGHNVVYFESLGLRNPSKESKRDLQRIFKRLLQFFKGTREINERLVIFSPLVIPKHSNRYVACLNNLLMRGYIKFFELGFSSGEVIHWTYNPLSGDFLKSKNIIYHCVDDLTAAPGLPVERIQIKEKELLEKSRVVFVTSKTLLEKFKSISESVALKVHYFSNVADVEHFSIAKLIQAVPQELSSFKKPILGFVGAISSYKVDFELLRYIAEKRPGWTIVLIGQVGEGQPDTRIDLLSDCPNINLIGPKDYGELPKYLAAFDVALLPCVINDYTRSMFPMKFYEYLAAGKKIVSTKLDSLKDLNDCCYLADTYDDFISAIERGLTSHFEEFVDVEKVDTLLKENTWEVRTKKMLGIIRK